MTLWTQPKPRNTAGAVRDLVPSRAGPPSSRQERAATQAARRYLPTPQHCPDSTSRPLQGAPTGDGGNLKPSSERGSTQHHATGATQPDAGARPEEPPCARNPQPTATPRPTRHQPPRNSAATHGRHHPLTPQRTDQETCPHRDSPAQLTAPVPPVDEPAPGPASSVVPARATTLPAGAPTRKHCHGPKPTVPQSQGPTPAKTLEVMHHRATKAGRTDMPTADRTQAVTDTAGCKPPGPHDPETHSEARTTENTGWQPTPPASPQLNDPTENTWDRAQGDGRRRQLRKTGLAAHRATGRRVRGGDR